MTTSQIYHQLAIERCRMYVAQLCAANHLDADNLADLNVQKDTVEALLRGLSNDLQVLEQMLDEDEV